MRQLSRAGLLPALALLGLAAQAAPAAAQFNAVTEQFDEIRSGLGFARPRPPMDFTERPPLVVPPNDALPPPGSGQMALGVNDTDTNNRRKALTDPRRPVPPSDPGAGVAGLAGRTYLVEPPAGLRDPSSLGPEPASSKGKKAVVEKVRHRGGRRRTPAPVEASK